MPRDARASESALFEKFDGEPKAIRFSECLRENFIGSDLAQLLYTRQANLIDLAITATTVTRKVSSWKMLYRILRRCVGKVCCINSLADRRKGKLR